MYILNFIVGRVLDYSRQSCMGCMSDHGAHSHFSKLTSATQARVRAAHGDKDEAAFQHAVLVCCASLSGTPGRCRVATRHSARATWPACSDDSKGRRTRPSSSSSSSSPLRRGPVRPPESPCAQGSPPPLRARLLGRQVDH